MSGPTNPAENEEVWQQGGVWTRARTVLALDLISKMDPNHAKHYLHHVAERLREPPLVSATCGMTRKWIADDAHPPDAEGIEDALPRHTGFTRIELGDPIGAYDGGDCYYHLYQPPSVDNDTDGIVIIQSPCGDEIHRVPDVAVHYSHGLGAIEGRYARYLSSIECEKENSK